MALEGDGWKPVSPEVAGLQVSSRESREQGILTMSKSTAYSS